MSHPREDSARVGITPAWPPGSSSLLAVGAWGARAPDPPPASHRRLPPLAPTPRLIGSAPPTWGQPPPPLHVCADPCPSHLSTFPTDGRDGGRRVAGDPTPRGSESGSLHHECGGEIQQRAPPPRGGADDARRIQRTPTAPTAAPPNTKISTLRCTLAGAPGGRRGGSRERRYCVPPELWRTRRR